MSTLEGIFSTHGKALLRHASVLVGPDDAADLVSETIMGALSSSRWESVDEPLNYLHASMVNQAKMAHRSSSRRRDREWRVSMAVAAAPSQPRLLDRPEIVEAVRSLSPQQRSVIYFSYWEDQRPADIARLLGVGEGTVKRHLARARAHLREVLQHG